MKIPLKETIKFPISGYDYEFSYGFSVVTGGEKPVIDAVYYFEKKKEIV